MQKFKKIGIVGGAGPMASSILYQHIIKSCQKRFNAIEDKDFPEIFIVSYPFSPMINIKESEQNINSITNELQNCIDLLSKVDVNVVGIACNTLHYFLDKIDFKKLEFINIINATLSEIKSSGIKKILLLGTSVTTSKDLYKNLDIEIILPNKMQQDILITIINKILAGKHSKKDAQECLSIIEILKKEFGIEGVILGCTEFSVLYKDYPELNSLDVRIFDSTEILGNQLLKQSIVNN